MFNNALLMAAASAAASVPGRYVIDYGCRLNPDDTTILKRTLDETPTNSTKGIVGGWFKKCGMGLRMVFWGAPNEDFHLGVNTSDVMHCNDHAHEAYVTNQVFRDPSAWYQIICSYDSDQEADGDRILFYYNGKRITDFSAYVPSKTSLAEAWGMTADTSVVRVGNDYNDSGIWSGYVSQQFLVDGKSIQNGDYSIGSFGEYNNNVWRPVDITGLTFGNNGWLLDFADSSDLGNDVSGNNNDFTSSGLATNDQVTDTPTNNFATLSSIDFSNNQEPTLGGIVVVSDGNLNLSWGSTNQGSARSTFGMTSGKYYTEVTYNDATTSSFSCGVVIGTDPLQQWPIADNEGRVHYDASGVIHLDGNNSATTGLATYTTGDVIGMQVDMDASPATIEFFKNGTTVTTQDLNTSFDRWFFSIFVGSATRDGNINFGQQSFAHTPAAGFKSLCTDNLPEPTIQNSKKYFDTILYEGNGLSQKVGQFQPIEEDYSVGNSALFIDDDSCYLSRTPSSVGDRRTMTFSFWFKKGNNGIQELLNSVTGLSNYMSFNTTNTFQLNTSGSGELRTTRTFEDPTQWYHFLVSIDTTQTTASDRLQIYVNGVQETDFGSETYPAQDTQMTWNTATGQFIGQSGSTTLFVDGYMAEAHFVDGQALAPSNFGEVDSTTNRWIPKEYTAGSVGSAVTVDFTANDSDSSDTTEYTFSSQSFGAADSDRKMVVGIVCYDDSPGTRVSAVTLGGVAANLVSGMIGAGATMTTEIWEADVPTGTTGDVVVTWAATVKSCGIGLWRLIGANSRPYGSGTTTADPGVLSTDIPAGGVAIGMSATGSGAGVTWTWTNLTENFEDAITSGARSQWSGASAAFASAQTDLDITADASTAADNTFVCSVWGPTDTSYGINGYYLNFADKNDLGKDAAAGSGLIAGSEGTVIGDLTLHGGNAAAFDGQRTHTTAGAANTGDPRYIGKTWDSAKTVTGFGIWSYTNKGFVEGATPTVTIKLYGKTGSAPSSSSDGTVLFTGTVTDSGASGPPATVENFSFTPASYDHNWVEISSGGANCHVAQVEFYEGGTATSSGNDFTSSGFDTTNGSNQFYDTPTRNFAIMDPGRSVTATMTDGNLLATSGGATGQVRTPNAFGLTSGKWYFEFLMVGGSSNERTMYITQDDVAVTNTQIRSTTGHYSGYYSFDGDAMTPGNPASATGEGEDYGDTYTAGDVISCALDLDIGAIWWAKNGTWQNSATEAEIEAGNSSKAAQTGLASGRWYPTMQNNTTQASKANFGQHIYFDSTALTLDTDAGGYFRHSVPDGFKAIHVDHLTGSDSFVSAFSWIKNRDATDNHMLFDRVRGRFSDLHSNTSAIPVTNEETLQRFLKQGAIIGSDVEVNTANESYIFWNWFMETAGSGTSNEDGSINTASTLVDTTAGISIGTYTGTGAGATIGHGLGAVPKMIMCKRTDVTEEWNVYHIGSNAGSGAANTVIFLSSTSAYLDRVSWNDTAPTSSVFSVGNYVGTNTSGGTYIYYAFADIEGYSKFGSYTGNANAFGPVIHTGFKPELVICKPTTGTTNWMMKSAAINPYNVVAETFYANETAAEATENQVDFLANGFKIRASSDINNATTIIYMAFAQNPFGGASTTPSTAY